MTRHAPTRRRFTSVAAALAAAVIALPACAQDVAPPAPGAPASSPDAAAPMFESAGDLLDALETADEGLRTLQSRITYMRIKALAMDVETRTGRLHFIAEPAEDGQRPERTFALDFTRRFVGNELARDSRSVLLFDGRRLYDKDYAQKLMVVRTVVKPGEEARDPLRLGEGPLPIPIGQKKDDILAQYDATLVEDLTAGLATPEHAEEMEARIYETVRAQATAAPGETAQLLLKAKRSDDELTEIRLWYRRGDDGRLLPFLARAVAFDGDISIIQLADVQINAPLTDAAAEAMSTDAPAGWTTERRDF